MMLRNVNCADGMALPAGNTSTSSLSTVNREAGMLAAIVANKINGELKSFLDEIANGTSNYRSLHSLTEQIEHQYHGRFLIELLQNAHDALTDGTACRIEIALLDDAGDHGTLCVANDGRPFSPSNFDSLSRLGQSDKKPDTAIGNKGIGFRSTLEISLEPRIFSRRSTEAKCFDGFCFGFSHRIVDEIRKPLLILLEGADNPVSPFGSQPLLPDWTQERKENFRAKVSKNAEANGMKPKDWLIQELYRLSPYQLPFPLGETDRKEHVASFERQGFATVICFPLKDTGAYNLVRRTMVDLNVEMLLFLSKASTVTLCTSETQREFFRKQTPLYSHPSNGKRQYTLVIGERGPPLPAASVFGAEPYAWPMRRNPSALQ
jgi:hypothetical protein